MTGQPTLHIRQEAAGEILGIAVLDHLIFNRKEHFSFLENGTAF